LIVLATPLVAALLGFYLWSVWRTRRRVPRAPDSVEASVMSTLMGNVKRLSRWRPRRGAGHRLSRLPGKESGSEADQGAGGGEHPPGSTSPLGERREEQGPDERARPRRREEESEHVRAASEDERHDRGQDDNARDAEERDHDAEREKVLRSRLFAEER